MKKVVFVSMLLAAVAFSVCGCTSAAGDTPMERKEFIADMHDDIVSMVAEKNPEIRRKIEQAPGYGVFSNVSVTVIFGEGGSGYGVVKNNKTGEKTYMKMALGGVGIGLGAKDFRQLIIFKSPEALNKFVEEGWKVGGHADATAKSGEKGGEATAAGTISEDVEIYQITENGLALQATVTAAKYWKDKKLN